MSDPYWTDGQITLYHGDCLDVLPCIEGVALTVTSPPYNMLGSLDSGYGFGLDRAATHNSTTASARRWSEKIADTRYEDSLPEEEYQEQQRHMAAAVAKASTPGASFFYNKCRWRNRKLIHPHDLVAGFTDWELQQEVIWARPGAPATGIARFRVTDERIYWLADRRGKPRFDNRPEGDGTVWRMRPVGQPHSGASAHPAPFPAEIPWKAMLSTTERGDLVLDPYSGSGTTLRVAKRLGRRAVGIEKNEQWCEMAVAGLGEDL